MDQIEQWRYSCLEGPEDVKSTVVEVWGTPVKAKTPQGEPLQKRELHSTEKESSEHLRWTHLEQVHHCADLFLQLIFQAHTEQIKTERECG